MSLPFLGTPRLICRSGFRGRPGCWAPVEASVESMEGPAPDGLPWVSAPVSGGARATCDVMSRNRNRKPAL